MKKILFLLFWVIPFLASAQYAFDEVFYFDNNKNVRIQIEYSGNSYLTFRTGNSVELQYNNAKVQKNYSAGTKTHLEFVRGYALSLELAIIEMSDDSSRVSLYLKDGHGPTIVFTTKDNNKTRDNRAKFLHLKSLLKK